MIPPLHDCPIKGKNGRYNLNYKECKYITDRKNATSSALKKHNDIFDHDPLRATLTVRFVPALTISYYNANDPSVMGNLTTLCHSSDLVILHNVVNTTEGLPDGIQMRDNGATRLYYKMFKLSCCKAYIPNGRTNIFIFDLQYHEVIADDRLISFAFTNPNVQEHFAELFKYIDATISYDLLIVMGDYTQCKSVINQSDLPPCGTLRHNDKYFIAYINKPVKPGMVTQFCSLNSSDSIQAELHFEFWDISCINVLHFNMEGSDSSRNISYLTSLNPKPDLLIFQKLIQNEKLMSTYDTHNFESPIVYNKDLFQIVCPLEMNNINAASIMTCIIKYLRILGNPEIMVASLDNSISTDKSCNAEACLKRLSSDKKFAGYPILIAGGFHVELDKLQNNKFGFTVPQCDPTIPRALECSRKLASLKRSQTPINLCTEFFAYRSASANTSIKLENVHAEEIEPYHGLVTGSGGYNIDYDQGIRREIKVTEHDPIRAKLTIAYNPLASKSSTPAKQPPTSTSVSKLSTPAKQSLTLKSSEIIRRYGYQ